MPEKGLGNPLVTAAMAVAVVALLLAILFLCRLWRRRKAGSAGAYTPVQSIELNSRGEMTLRADESPSGRSTATVVGGGWNGPSKGIRTKSFLTAHHFGGVASDADTVAASESPPPPPGFEGLDGDDLDDEAMFGDGGAASRRGQRRNSLSLNATL
ncbi:unnamed protein product [Phaeothamnion confervicola]